MSGSAQANTVVWAATSSVLLLSLFVVGLAASRAKLEPEQNTVSHAARALNAPPGQTGIRLPPRRVSGPFVVDTADMAPPVAAKDPLSMLARLPKGPVDLLRVSDILFTRETHESQSVPLTYSDGPFWLRSVIQYDEGEFCDAVDAAGNRHLIKASEIDWRRTTDRPLVRTGR